MSNAMTSDILTPFFGMLCLTLIVWTYMYVRRLGYVLSHSIPNDQVSTPEKIATAFPEAVNNSSNNLKNLFELPVLFYAVSLYLYSSHSVDGLHVLCAYVFVSFRALHSLIHCTFNQVLLRFGTYLIAAVALWVMVIRTSMALVYLN